MKKVLLITDVNFWEGSSGHRARISALTMFLATKVDLTVVITGPAPATAENEIAALYRARFCVLEMAEGLGSEAYGILLKKRLKNKRFDSVIIEYIHSSYFLSYLNGCPQLIVDIHDIISDRAAEFQKFSLTNAIYGPTWERELEILGYYDHIITICRPDFERLSGALPGRTLLCPHPVVSIPCSTRPQVETIGFVASSYLPNAEGINHFIQNCWPEIRKKHAVRLTIYGTVCGMVNTFESPDIVLHGFVPAVDEIYREIDVVINPVRFGAGLKIKNIEALGYGRPLVTTVHGSRGIEEAQGVAFFGAADSADMVFYILKLIENRPLRKRMALAASDFVRKKFSPEVCFNPLLEAIEFNNRKRSPDQE